MSKLTPEQAVRRILLSGRCTEACARALGLVMRRDRWGCWYVGSIDGPKDQREPGYTTKAIALEHVVYKAILAASTPLTEHERTKK